MPIPARFRLRCRPSIASFDEAMTGVSFRTTGRVVSVLVGLIVSSAMECSFGVGGFQFTRTSSLILLFWARNEEDRR